MPGGAALVRSQPAMLMSPNGLPGSCKGAPSLISSFARRTIMSPAFKLPSTSMRSPSAAPLRTSTHSACPSLLRTRKGRSVVVTTLVFGTKSEDRRRRIGHFTLAEKRICILPENADPR